MLRGVPLLSQSPACKQISASFWNDPQELCLACDPPPIVLIRGGNAEIYLHFPGHEIEKFWEVDGTIAVSINLQRT